MPYNTRRKSLSLPSLGIQLPQSTRLHRPHSKASSPTEHTTEQPPSKRVKREHSTPSPLPTPRETPPAESIETQHPKRHVEQTPPPSPGHVVPHKKIDLEGIKDDVVISVIEQLEKTGNRPHLIKEMATVLLSTNTNIANSANPAALLSSRLTQYMRRPWSALSPCPIAKELIPVHPRKVFFFLTTQPRAPLPENSDDIIVPIVADIKRLTPSISDPSINEDAELEILERSRMSPSPEVDLFSPELDDGTPAPTTPGSSFSPRMSLAPEPAPMIKIRRAPSPSLEADEKGFTETASAVRASRMLREKSPNTLIAVDFVPSKVVTEQDTALELFGKPQGTLTVDHRQDMLSSPMMSAKYQHQYLTLRMPDLDADMDDATWTIRSPELVDVDELDEILADY